MKKIPFAAPDMTEAEVNAVTQCVRSGWLTSGAKVVEFERKFAEYLIRRANAISINRTPEILGLNAIAVNSATSGLVLALRALGIGDGHEVITSPYTFTATAEAIERVGATPVFADVAPFQYNIDTWWKLENLITERTRAIIPVHFGGQVCGMGRLFEFRDKYGLKIIEDAAHALPSFYGNQIVGTLDTDATVFSFYATKPLCTGEGGMIVTKHKEVADQCRLMRIHGIDKSAYERSSTHYDVVTAGDKCNMPDTAAAMGLVQLQRLDDMHRRRAKIAQHYNAELGSFIGLPPSEGDHENSWHLYPARLPNDWMRGHFLMEMLDDYGIQCGVHYIPVHLHPYWHKKYGFRPTDFPHAYNAYKHEVSLPIYSAMTDSDVERVVDAVKKIVK